MEYAQKRVSPLLAQILARMQENQQFQPQSYGALAAGLGSAFLDKQSLNKAMQQEQMQRAAQQSALARALSQKPEGIQLDTLSGDPVQMQQTRMDPQISSLAGSLPPEVLQQAASSQLAQLLAGPPKKEYLKVGPDDTLVDPETMTPTFTGKGKPEWKLGQTRDFKQGKETVTQEVAGFDPGGAPLWRELGRGEGGPLAVATSYGDMTPATATDTQKGLLEGAQTLDNLYTLRDQFNPEYLTLGGKVKNSLLRNIDKLDPELLSEDQRKYLTDYKQFNTSAYGAINDYIRSVTGAQLSMYESERIMQGMANVKDNSPTEFISALDTTLDKLHWAAVRKKLALALEKPFEKISLDGVQGMVDEYGKQREAAYLKSGMSKEEAQEMAKADVIRLGR